MFRCPQVQVDRLHVRTPCRIVSGVGDKGVLEGAGVEVGARFRFHQHLDRPRAERIEFDVDVEILEIGDRSITWAATDKFQERLIRLSVEPDGFGSKITQVTTASFLRPPGIVKWVYPFLARRTFKEQFE